MLTKRKLYHQTEELAAAYIEQGNFCSNLMDWNEELMDKCIELEKVVDELEQKVSDLEYELHNKKEEIDSLEFRIKYPDRIIKF